MTLTELLVVVAVMSILLSISVPTAQHLMKGFESSTGVRHLINAALSNARAIAVRQQAYAGVRFQQDVDGDKTYMILIVYDKEATGDADGFRAVIGRKPMELPEDISVSAYVQKPDETWSTESFFSVLFSPSGKLTIHEAQCLHSSTADTIFNSTGDSMFTEDGDSWFSVQDFVLVKEDKYGTVVESTTEYISPYTGELVMEYK